MIDNHSAYKFLIANESAFSAHRPLRHPHHPAPLTPTRNTARADFHVTCRKQSSLQFLPETADAWSRFPSRPLRGSIPREADAKADEGSLTSSSPSPAFAANYLFDNVDSPRVTNHRSRATSPLIDNMIIRIHPKPFALNKNSISNRQYSRGHAEKSIRVLIGHRPGTIGFAFSIPAFICVHPCLPAVAGSSVDSNWFVLKGARPLVSQVSCFNSRVPRHSGVPKYQLPSTPDSPLHRTLAKRKTNSPALR
jgi:hypothetical protein